MSRCEICNPGTYSPTEGSAKCLECEPGTYQPSIEQSSCIKCERGYYSADSGSKTCLLCPVGSFTEEGESECWKVPEGVDCRGGECRIKDGYWTNITVSNLTHDAVIVKCLNSQSCLSDYEGELKCTNGYEGPLCALCGDGYVQSSHGCTKCYPQWLSIIIVIIQLLLPFFYVGVNIYFKTNLGKKKRWSFEYRYIIIIIIIIVVYQ